MSSIVFYSTRKTQKLDRIGALKGETLWDFSTFLSQNINKTEGGDFGELFSKIGPTMPEKTKSETL